MSTLPPPTPRFSYDTHARSCAPTDFRRQVLRTVAGEPISDGQVAMIQQAIRLGLALRPDSVLLDLCCGNGALSEDLFGDCLAYTGVDISDYMISVANAHFARPPEFSFVSASVPAFVQSCVDAERYTHGLAYAGFQYLSDDEVEATLQALNIRFGRLQRVFVGNHPDRDRAAVFFRNGRPGFAAIDDHGTAIGRFRSRADLSAIARRQGWRVDISHMPSSFSGAAYRFDAVLTR